MADPTLPKKPELPLDVTLAGFQNAIANEEDLGVVFDGLTISTDLQKNLIVLANGAAPKEHIELRILAANDEAGAQAESDQLDTNLGDQGDVMRFGQVSIENNLCWVAAIRPVPTATKPVPGTQVVTPAFIKQITDIAVGSTIASRKWKNGFAPIGYIKGMALVFARVYCKMKNEEDDARDMAKASTGDQRDALTFYRQQFANAGLHNDRDGADTLRHLFMVLIGLAMPESSGRWDEGIDQTEINKRKAKGTLNAETTEAGLFQTSWNARNASPLMPKLFDFYKANRDTGFLEVFKEGAPARGINNVGTGDGADFQQLSKVCPAFAAEFTGVGLRHIGAGRNASGDWLGHWGTIASGLVEIRPECDTMLQQVQAAVDAAGMQSV